MTPVTAQTVRENCLEPVMDATAQAMAMRRLLHRPETRQVDSVREVLAVLHGSLQMLDDLVQEIAHANGMQLPDLQRVSGWADGLVSDLHAAERSDDPPPSGRQVARTVIGLLDVIDSPTAPIDERSVALTDLFLLFGRLGDLIWHDRTTYHLGKRRVARLRELHATWMRRRERRRRPTRARESVAS